MLNLIKTLMCSAEIVGILSLDKNWQSGVMGACRSHRLKVGGSSPVGGGTSLDVRSCERW